MANGGRAGFHPKLSNLEPQMTNVSQLTAAQAAARDSRASKILALAGPGAGKTTVLAERIRRILFDGEMASAIAAITFTNEAARNIERRLGFSANSPINDGPISLGYAGTLHGFALRMLRHHGAAVGYRPDLAVIDEDAAKELLAEKAAQQGCRTPIDRLVELKSAGRPKRLFGTAYSREQLVVVAYCTELREAGLIDYDLILTEFRDLLEEPIFLEAIAARFSHILWDEVQDSGRVDWQIIRALPIRNKFLVGDPDQAIYGFRGAAQDQLLAFATQKDVEVITLAENFRCCPEVCAAANRLISRNTERIKKLTVAATEKKGFVEALAPFSNEGTEVGELVDGIRDALNVDKTATFAILARSNKVVAPFASALKAAGIPVENEVRDNLPRDWPLARALLEYLANPNSDTLGFFYLVAREENRGAKSVDARRKASEIRRGAQIAGKTINEQWFRFTKWEHESGRELIGRLLDKEGLCRETCAIVAKLVEDLPAGAGAAELALAAAALERAPEDRRVEGVFVGTVHAAKGREWDFVYVVGFEDELTPGHRKFDSAEEELANLEEERRVAFVAITRARYAVYFSSSSTRQASWGNRPIEKRTPSRFIEEATT